MIIRARPKYLKYEDLKENKGTISEALIEDELFFNKGRSALKFLLEHLAILKGKTLNVAIQSFNCEVVYQGVVQAKCSIQLYDNNLIDFSASLSEIQSLHPFPDAVVLTHYQGIPNLEYAAISNYCLKSNIFLIDDMSHTEGSKVENIEIGSLADASLHSFTFDKPFSTYKGGSLKIKNIKNSVLKQGLLKSYASLKKEPFLITNMHIRILDFLMKNSEPLKVYEYEILEFLFLILVPGKIVHYLIHSDFFKINWIRVNMVINKFIRSNNKIKIWKMPQRKIQMILRQRKVFYTNGENPEVLFLEKFLKENSIETAYYPFCDVKWNRYSVLDREGKINRVLNKKEIDFGNFTWPIPLHLLHKEHSKGKSFVNAEITSNHIVNIPIWSNFFRSIYSEQ